MIKSRFNGKSSSSFEGDDVSPMENVANLSDVMLVLAVGMMLAVIIAWQVDIGTVLNTEQVQAEEMVEIEGETVGASEDSDAMNPEEYGFYEAGKLYKDAEGNYYMMPEK